MSYQDRFVPVTSQQLVQLMVCDGCGKESQAPSWISGPLIVGWYQIGAGSDLTALDRMRIVHACSDACVLPAIDKLKAEASEVGVVL